MKDDEPPLRPEAAEVPRQDGSGDAWTLREYASLDDVVRIESLDCELPLRDLYDMVCDA